VASGSTWVRVVRERVAAYAGSLTLEAVPQQLDPEFHFQGDADSTAAFVVVLDAINFGSGYFPHLRRRDERSGYFHVARALTERWRHRPLDAAELAAMRPETCAAIFGQPREGPAFELMTLFAAALSALGTHLVERHAASAVRLVEAAEGSAERLAGLLAAVPFFDDVHEWRGHQVPIYKRAQITPSDLALALGGRGLGEFADLGRLTIFADNLVPHVLRLDGVLEFEPVLLERIDRGELLVSGSAEEVEMRACAIHACELLLAEPRPLARRLTARDLDNLLWNRGQQHAYKARPRPRCRSIYY
jgi:Queuosine salvage protein